MAMERNEGEEKHIVSCDLSAVHCAKWVSACQRQTDRQTEAGEVSVIRLGLVR